MADDLGWGEPGLYNSTSPHGRISTPNLDQFGREGTIFTDAYAGYTVRRLDLLQSPLSPLFVAQLVLCCVLQVCAPSRTTLFTGRHSGQFDKLGLNGQDLTVAENMTTLAMMLQKVGYKTGM
jgi:arylsulfatase A-like enzyme